MGEPDHNRARKEELKTYHNQDKPHINRLRAFWKIALSAGITFHQEEGPMLLVGGFLSGDCSRAYLENPRKSL